jgi:hypothetical protein
MLQEHMRDRYSVCWSTPSADINKDGMLDAAVCDAQSHDLHQRWSNYYVAGLEWLVSEPPHMDGILQRSHCPACLILDFSTAILTLYA